uniref:Uncharacterized protein n=1 Tax=Candidatus Kentrum sp. FM TaxID=2126340 RepID=A0A450TNV7_9GAMM|nr:MAG: hypothetical protein BECKFM1743C_GA0114222_105252 [Candidatus Kentron sp. FM]
MTTLYAWNTARAGSVAYPNVREARLFHPTRGRQFFDLGSIHLSPNKKIRPKEIAFFRDFRGQNSSYCQPGYDQNGTIRV